MRICTLFTAREREDCLFNELPLFFNLCLFLIQKLDEEEVIDTFNFILVGAGSTGVIVAAQLNENPAKTEKFHVHVIDI